MAKKKRIPIKNQAEIEKMRVAGKIASSILQETASFIAVGKTTLEVDLFAAERMKYYNCRSAFLGYRGFPSHTCLSINEEVVHGIASSRIIQDGDIVSLDVGIKKNGWIGDNAVTVPVGTITEEHKSLMLATEESLYEAIQHARSGEYLANLCGSVEDYVVPRGYSVVRDLVGHGVGKELHEEPQVPNYRSENKGPILKPGMILAIEPMVNLGTGNIVCQEDKWTIVTKDGAYSAHYEHTVLITEGDPEILTPRPRLKF